MIHHSRITHIRAILLINQVSPTTLYLLYYSIRKDFVAQQYQRPIDVYASTQRTQQKKMVQLQTNMDTCRPWLQFLSCDWIFSSGIRFCQGSPAIQSGLFSTHSRQIFVQFHCDCSLSRHMVFPPSLSNAEPEDSWRNETPSSAN